MRDGAACLHRAKKMRAPLAAVPAPADAALVFARDVRLKVVLKPCGAAALINVRRVDVLARARAVDARAPHVLALVLVLF